MSAAVVFPLLPFLTLLPHVGLLSSDQHCPALLQLPEVLRTGTPPAPAANIPTLPSAPGDPRQVLLLPEVDELEPNTKQCPRAKKRTTSKLILL